MLKHTGIPVGVGIAGTKTLAKLANHAAKRWAVHSGGVVDLRVASHCEWVLKKCDVSEVWGIGKRLTAHLQGMGIRTAWDLSRAAPGLLRKAFSVVVEKTARELAGSPCLQLHDIEPPRQEICCSRMFGKRLTEQAPIKEAVATYVMRAAEKLRGQRSLASKMRVSIRTGMFNPDEVAEGCFSAHRRQPSSGPARIYRPCRTSRNTSGRDAAICRRDRAAPDGMRRPCSHS